MAELGSENEILGRSLKRYFSFLPNANIVILIAPMNSIKSIFLCYFLYSLLHALKVGEK